MTTKLGIPALAGLIVLGAPAFAADVSQDAIDACIDAARAQGAQGGTVLSTEFSEANSLVMLRDSSGTEWRCLVDNQGRSADLSRVGGGAGGGMQDAGGPAFWEVRVNTTLNVHSAPSTSAPTVARLRNGMVVENRGCLDAEGRTWCEIADGDASGWAAAEFLMPASGENTATADDGGGAMAGSSGGEPVTTTERVRFATGTTGAELTGSAGPGGSVRYVLGASAGQDLYVRVAANGPGMSFQIFNPDGSLLDQMGADREYRGELWQSGDHVIEVINRGNATQSFNVIFGID
jgi:hypothetical protein